MARSEGPRPIGGRRPTLLRRSFAWLTRQFEPSDDAAYRTYKRALFADLTGTVVEIGPGTGANLAYLPPAVKWTGVEPNPFMQEFLREKAAALGRTIDLRTGAAEALPFPTGSIETVIATLVLCSVGDQDAVLHEIVRVLQPGGRFLFIEHVAAPRGTWLRRLQWLTGPLWRTAFDGCRADRKTWTAIEQAGFARVELTHFRIAGTIGSPHIVGMAVKGE